ncbi:MAG TPA: hypothetical protein VHJ82_08645, partial [Actinomycetota bacterium]|nr:hypothetical protein [Actinomycetota bacterium]
MQAPDSFYQFGSVARAVTAYGLTPAFLLWQVVRLHRALHIFQLEGYRRRRFLDWCRSSRSRALFLKARPAKKPMVMTGRAWRLLITSVLLSAMFLLGPAAVLHVTSGSPSDLATWFVMAVMLFFGVPYVVVAADMILSPIQQSINGRYLSAARAKLQRVRPAVVGITGSFGKTSTKFAVAALAGGPETVLATPASYNTPLGVARAINEGLGPQHRVLVVE